MYSCYLREILGRNNHNYKWKKEFGPDNFWSCKNLSNIYKILNWRENPPYDTINSFFTICSYALKIYYPDDFKIENNNSVEFNSNKNNDFVSEKKLLVYTKQAFKFEEYDKVNNLQCIQDLARLTHSFGNFMPCPRGNIFDNSYNQFKGKNKSINDFFDLMLAYLKNNTNDWSNGILESVLLWILDGYVEISSDNNIMIKYFYDLHLLIGNVYPKTEEEIIKCISEMNKRITIRGLKMVKQINTCQEVRDKCNEIIKKISNL